METTTSRTHKLGKKPPVVDKRTLRFGKYLTLPAPPQSVAYYEKVATWPMYYNNEYGDCTCAAAAHMIQNWTANARNDQSARTDGPQVLRALRGLATAP